MFQHFIALPILAMVATQSDAFALPTAIFLPRTTCRDSGALGVAVSVCDLANQSRHAESSELNNAFEKWTLQLFNDSSNTRSYVCRCLAQVAGLSEDESYRKMMQAHAHGKSVIGEYRQEHAEHYKEGLTSSGLVCDIFPVED